MNRTWILNIIATVALLVTLITVVTINITRPSEETESVPSYSPTPSAICTPTPTATPTTTPSPTPVPETLKLVEADAEMESIIRLIHFEQDIQDMICVVAHGVTYYFGFIDGEWVLLEVAYG